MCMIPQSRLSLQSLSITVLFAAHALSWSVLHETAVIRQRAPFKLVLALPGEL